MKELNTRLRGTHIPSFMEDDRIIWDKKSNGEFSVKFSYDFLVSDGDNLEWKYV